MQINISGVHLGCSPVVCIWAAFQTMPPEQLKHCGHSALATPGRTLKAGPPEATLPQHQHPLAMDCSPEMPKHPYTAITSGPDFSLQATGCELPVSGSSTPGHSWVQHSCFHSSHLSHAPPTRSEREPPESNQQGCADQERE